MRGRKSEPALETTKLYYREDKKLYLENGSSRSNSFLDCRIWKRKFH